MAPSAPRPWTVLPNDPLQKHDDHLWSISGALPKGHMNRRMSMVKLSDGRLAFHNGVPMAEDDMKAMEAWGEPGFLVVPNGYHRLDVHAWKARYPKMKVVAPAAARAKVAEKVDVDGSWELLPKDPNLEAIVYRGSKIDEAVLVAKSGGRASLIFGDMVMNIPTLAGLDGFVFKLLGSVGGPRVTNIAKLALVKDKAALKVHLAELAQLPGLFRLIPSHGVNMEGEEQAKAAMAEIVNRL